MWIIWKRDRREPNNHTAWEMGHSYPSIFQDWSSVLGWFFPKSCIHIDQPRDRAETKSQHSFQEVTLCIFGDSLVTITDRETGHGDDFPHSALAAGFLC